MNNITKLVISLLIASGLYSCTGSSNELDEVAPKLMWIDATANIERFNNKDTIDYYLEKVKDLGFTD
ncbi:MAG: S-layer protein, partial [Proteiniphilum sp.]|nr:S-layer protein [Proteiniphilum sp.]